MGSLAFCLSTTFAMRSNVSLTSASDTTAVCSQLANMLARNPQCCAIFHQPDMSDIRTFEHPRLSIHRNPRNPKSPARCSRSPGEFPHRPYAPFRPQNRQQTMTIPCVHRYNRSSPTPAARLAHRPDGNAAHAASRRSARASHAVFAPAFG